MSSRMRYNSLHLLAKYSGLVWGECRMHPIFKTIVVTAALGGCAAAMAVEPTGNAVEWFHPGLGHYFFTSGPEEIARIDPGGAGGGLIRPRGQVGPLLA